ncbi:MAG TPA: hypothetical protein VNL17_14565 [Verrucomicrobiae bacterium]|nr:hypothetical protein [Verrucomicrobiae bacterium]
MMIKQLSAAEHAGRSLGDAFARKLMAPGVVGIVDPYGMARREAKIGVRLQTMLADKLAYERGFNEQFKAVFAA